MSPPHRRRRTFPLPPLPLSAMPRTPCHRIIPPSPRSTCRKQKRPSWSRLPRPMHCRLRRTPLQRRPTPRTALPPALAGLMLQAVAIKVLRVAPLGREGCQVGPGLWSPRCWYRAMGKVRPEWEREPRTPRRNVQGLGCGKRSCHPRRQSLRQGLALGVDRLDTREERDVGMGRSMGIQMGELRSRVGRRGRGSVRRGEGRP